MSDVSHTTQDITGEARKMIVLQICALNEKGKHFAHFTFPLVESETSDNQMQLKFFN